MTIWLLNKFVKSYLLLALYSIDENCLKYLVSLNLCVLYILLYKNTIKSKCTPNIEICFSFYKLIIICRPKQNVYNKNIQLIVRNITWDFQLCYHSALPWTFATRPGPETEPRFRTRCTGGQGPNLCKVPRPPLALSSSWSSPTSLCTWTGTFAFSLLSCPKAGRSTRRQLRLENRSFNDFKI